MQKVSKTVTKRMLVLTKSQAKYLNDLGSDSSDSSSSSSSESSVASSSSTPQSSSSSAQSSSTSVPKEYKSALNSADIYANTMHMSKAGLYEQLTADAGDEFS
ncbi:Ltp family lipoprotein, partial [Lactococcus lactis]|nr:Ltp family lipoprotein [Lactococcus lactis]